MLTLVSSIDGINVIHLIIGPESHMVMDLTGMMGVDITEFLEKFKESPGKTIIQITRCQSEQALAQFLNISGMQQMKDFTEKTQVSGGKPSGTKCEYCQASKAIEGTNPPQCQSCITLNKGLGGLKVLSSTKAAKPKWANSAKG